MCGGYPPHNHLIPHAITHPSLNTILDLLNILGKKIFIQVLTLSQEDAIMSMQKTKSKGG